MTTLLSTKQIPSEQLLQEVEKLLRDRPSAADLRSGSDAVLEWRGRAVAVIENMPGILTYSGFKLDLEHACDRSQLTPDAGKYHSVIATIYQARAQLLFECRGAATTIVEQGKHLDYFKGIRDIILLAKSEIFFVDPYLEAEFVSQYLTSVPAGTAIRLMASKNKQTKGWASLVPALQSFKKQYGNSIELRQSENIHDRFIIINKKDCYSSGGSFKDGPKNAASVIVQLLDPAQNVIACYENEWSSAQPTAI